MSHEQTEESETISSPARSCTKTPILQSQHVYRLVGTSAGLMLAASAPVCQNKPCLVDSAVQVLHPFDSYNLNSLSSVGSLHTEEYDRMKTANVKSRLA